MMEWTDVHMHVVPHVDDDAADSLSWLCEHAGQAYADEICFGSAQRLPRL